MHAHGRIAHGTFKIERKTFCHQFQVNGSIMTGFTTKKKRKDNCIYPSPSNNLLLS